MPDRKNWIDLTSCPRIPNKPWQTLRNRDDQLQDLESWVSPISVLKFQGIFLFIAGKPPILGYRTVSSNMAETSHK